MGGFGSDRYGEGLFGADVVALEPARAHPTAPTAMMYDPATRGFPLDADGRVRQVHPVDQKVALRMTIAKGKIKGVPDLGNTFATLARQSQAQAEDGAKKIVADLLADLVRAKDITIVNVVADASVRGRTMIGLEYVNNRTGARVKQ